MLNLAKTPRGTSERMITSRVRTTNIIGYYSIYHTSISTKKLRPFFTGYVFDPKAFFLLDNSSCSPETPVSIFVFSISNTPFTWYKCIHSDKLKIRLKLESDKLTFDLPRHIFVEQKYSGPWPLMQVVQVQWDNHHVQLEEQQSHLTLMKPNNRILKRVLEL